MAINFLEDRAVTRVLILVINPLLADFLCCNSAKDYYKSAVAYPGFYKGRGRGAAGTEWGGAWGGGIPLPTGGKVWEGVVPLPRKFFVFFC